MVVTFFHHMGLRYKFWLVFHLLLGVAATFSMFPVIISVYSFLLMAMLELIINGNRYGVVHLVLFYFIGFELLGRMVGGSPFIPWESGKYLAVPLLLFGIITCGGRYLYLGSTLILLSLPGVLISILVWNITFDDIVFNYFGLLTMILGLIYFSNQRTDANQQVLMARLLIMPVISVLTYVIIASPDIQTIDFGGESTSSATGGYGTNQVSTILGVGFFIPLIFYLMRTRLFPYHLLNIGITALFLFRSMLSFSRGGVYVPTFAIALPFLILKKNISSGQYLKYLLIGGLILGGVFLYTNQLTENALSERYTIEKEQQVEAGKEELLNEYSTGRWNILMQDLNIWREHPILGVGVGISRYQHPNQAAAHIEFSRLASEHGLLGLIIAVCLFICLPIGEIINRRNNQERIWVLALITLSILSTFHAATRTLMPAILYGAAFLNIKSNNHPVIHEQKDHVHRQ